MNVLMVHVRSMGMGVGHRLMGVLVAVAASWHYYVHMCMVPIVVPVIGLIQEGDMQERDDA